MGSNTFLVGIAGGSASGKTTLAREIRDALRPNVALIEQDFYYRDRSHLPLNERDKINFDHPDSLDFDFMYEQLSKLKSGQTVRAPYYDFCTFSSENDVIEIKPTNIIIVEGILIFAVEKIRELFDITLFLDVPADLRLLRRIQRDMRERGRDLERINNQYLREVRPMHEEFVQPCKEYSDIVISGDWNISETVDAITKKLSSCLEAAR